MKKFSIICLILLTTIAQANIKLKDNDSSPIVINNITPYEINVGLTNWNKASVNITQPNIPPYATVNLT